ncbi:Omp85 family outer membrane protein [Rhodoflexus sp.]
MKKFVFTLWVLICSTSAFAQEVDTVQKQQELPFYIDPVKRMDELELADKKEGSFITGVPRFEFDPIRGFGIGGTVNFFANKTKADPFFPYTPYRHNLTAEFFIFQNGRIRYALNYDAPYIFNSQWRLRADVVFWEDPHAQYWGIGREFMKRPLRFRDKQTGQERDFHNINDYERNLSIAERGADGRYYNDHHYHHIEQREQLYNLLGERVLMGGKLRLMFGYEALFTSFSSFKGRVAEVAVNSSGEKVKAINNITLVDKQIADGTWDRFNLAGFTGDERSLFTSMLAGAIIYDTRDFEPDASRGVFLEYSHEYSAPWLGSYFNFNKFMAQGQVFHTLGRWRDGKSRLTFAGLAAFGHIFGSKINFIEMWDLSSQAEAGGILVMGGARSLRGYREARFMAPTMALVNLEMRARLYDFHLFRQHFALGITPFYDFGSAWDSPRDFNFQYWKGSPGIGGRVNWNQSTVLRLDYAQSREGGQVFFGFGHIF